MYPLIIRADANTKTGTGHVMRCLALAQAWQEAGGDVYFLTAFKLPAIETRLTDEGFKVILLDVEPGSRTDAEQTANIAHRLGGDWLVVDGYHFGADYQKIIKDNKLKLLFIDDYGHAGHYYADIVLNQNIYAAETLYTNREPDTRLLLGAKYVLLRREFWRLRGWQREIPTAARKILVTLGGGDPDNVTLKVIRALQHVALDNLEVVVVVGGSNPHLASLRSAVEDSPYPVQLVYNVTNMQELMAWADIAISAGGSTCWEMAFLGLPNLIVVLAANQKLIAEALDQVGVAINLGWYDGITPDEIANVFSALVWQDKKLNEMSHQGQQLVDGGGVARVVETLINSIGRT